MKCPKCQAENNEGVRNCEQCGAELVEVSETIIEDAANNAQVEVGEMKVESPAEQLVAGDSSSAKMTKDVVTNPVNSEVSNETPNVEKVNFLGTIKRVFLKPVTMIREDLPKYKVPKNAAIMAALAVAATLIVTLITVSLRMVFRYSCAYGGRSSNCNFSVNFDLLEHYRFGDLIFETILSSIISILITTGVLFGVSRLFKYKKVSFWKLLTITSLTMFPMMAMNLIGGIVGIFSAGAATCLMAIGVLYSMVVFYEGVMDEVRPEGDKRVFYMVLSSVAVLVVMMLVAWLIGDKIGWGSDVLSF